MLARVRVAAHAKANPFLRVLSRESTGYHGIETVLTLLELRDEITVEKTDRPGIELTVAGADTGPTEENLAYRAAAIVLEAVRGGFGVRIHVEKHIPVRAGLGGGSSDAAATLHAVNALVDAAVPRHELLQFGARLGADVPFFVSGAAAALAWNRGERLFHLPSIPAAPVLLVVPEFGISTPNAYRAVDAANPEYKPRGGVVFDLDAFRHWGAVGRLGGNDFESVLFAREPSLRTLYERLAETRPLLTRMCGSGSALFAVYRSDAERQAAATVMGSRDHRLIATATRQAVAPPPRSLEST